MEANTEVKKEYTKDELMKIPLLVATELKGIHEKSGQEMKLVFGDRIDYDENGKNPVVWYKTVG